jgi:hypothetical protein
MYKTNANKSVCVCENVLFYLPWGNSRYNLGWVRLAIGNIHIGWLTHFHPSLEMGDITRVIYVTFIGVRAFILFEYYKTIGQSPRHNT